MKLKIGELLVQGGLISEQQLMKALQAQRNYGGKLGTNLIELGFVSEIDLAAFLSKQLKIPSATPLEFDKIHSQALAVISRDTAAQYKMVPLSVSEANIRIAISDPYNLEALDELQFRLGRKVEAVIAPEIWIIAALERYYQVTREVRFIPITDEGGEDGFSGEVVNVIANTFNTDEYQFDAAKEMVQGMNEFGSVLLDADGPVGVFSQLFRFLTPVFPKMAVYSIRKNEINGQVLFGFPVHNKAFMGIQIPFERDSLVRRVALSQNEFSGKLPTDTTNRELFGILGLQPDQKIALYPIPFKERIIAVLLGIPDVGLATPRPDAGLLVSEALSKAGAALEILYLKKRIVTSPRAAR